MRDPDDKKQFAEILRATLDIYGKDASVPVMQLWWAALFDRSIDEVRIGFSRYIKSADSGTFPPKPADIIRMIDGCGRDRGALAWTKVIDGVRAAGYPRSVTFDDPIINCVLDDMGGWVKICTGQASELSFVAAEFERRYRAYAEHGIQGGHPKFLPGASEAENAARGYPVDPPMLIGDPEKAMKVLQSGMEARRVSVTSLAAMLERKEEGARAIACQDGDDNFDDE